MVLNRYLLTPVIIFLKIDFIVLLFLNLIKTYAHLVHEIYRR
jgi:hypothetical protein